MVELGLQPELDTILTLGVCSAAIMRAKPTSKTMNFTRFILATVAACFMTLSLGGCYEKVTRSRQWPGMNMTDASLPPTARDGRLSNSKSNQGSGFDPLGAIFKPVASVARGIGEFGSSIGSGLTPDNSNNNSNSTNNPNTGTDPELPSADPGGGRIGGDSGGTNSPFDTSPD